MRCYKPFIPFVLLVNFSSYGVFGNPISLTFRVFRASFFRVFRAAIEYSEQVVIENPDLSLTNK
jgi:hypothetical protein